MSQSFFLLFLFAAVASDLAVELLFDPGHTQKGIPRPTETRIAAILASFTSVLVCLMQFAGTEPEGLELFLRQVF